MPINDILCYFKLYNIHTNKQRQKNADNKNDNMVTNSNNTDHINKDCIYNNNLENDDNSYKSLSTCKCLCMKLHKICQIIKKNQQNNNIETEKQNPLPKKTFLVNQGP